MTLPSSLSNCAQASSYRADWGGAHNGNLIQLREMQAEGAAELQTR
jgi:hypothetical protein